MKRILIIGAGRSSGHLISKLSSLGHQHNWHLTIADRDISAAELSVRGLSNARAVELDIDNDSSLSSLVAESDICASMLPAALHLKVAKACLNYRVHLFTASYLSKEMKEMHAAISGKGLLFMNELGLDPGIDHMSAKVTLDRLKEEGNEMIAFESFTGGLIAPESDDNPWNYKFTWNPRNVVLAGQGGIAKFIENNQYKYIPPHQIFRRTETIEIPGLGMFEGYANRDSLKYRESYGLNDIPTIYRGTLRRKGFSKSWSTFVQLGMTDDSFVMEGSKDMTHRDFTNSFLFYHPSDSVELKLKYYLGFDFDSDEMDKLKWLGLFDNTAIGLEEDASPARILEQILKKKWSLKQEDKDMIVMWHKFVYRKTDGSAEQINSYMVVKGENQDDTAMSKTVGLPLAFGMKHFLIGSYQLEGAQIPLDKSVYQPILDDLSKEGIEFHEDVFERPDLT